MASTADLTGPYGGKKSTRGSSIEFLTDTFQVFRARVTFNVSEIIESAFVLLILALLHSSEKLPSLPPPATPSSISKFHFQIDN